MLDAPIFEARNHHAVELLGLLLRNDAATRIGKRKFGVLLLAQLCALVAIGLNNSLRQIILRLEHRSMQSSTQCKRRRRHRSLHHRLCMHRCTGLQLADQ